MPPAGRRASYEVFEVAVPAFVLPLLADFDPDPDPDPDPDADADADDDPDGALVIVPEAELLVADGADDLVLDAAVLPLPLDACRTIRASMSGRNFGHANVNVERKRKRVE